MKDNINTNRPQDTQEHLRPQDTQEHLILKEYNKFTTEDLELLGYTGTWAKDKRRFMIEHKKNQEIF